MEGVSEATGPAVPVGDGVEVWCPAVVAVGLVGRSGWSVGLAMMLEAAEVEATLDVVLPATVVVLLMIASWSLSSSSDGMGRRVVFVASILSPHSLRCQSMKVPLNSFTTESLIMIVQVPIPDSPLELLENARLT